MNLEQNLTLYQGLIRCIDDLHFWTYDANWKILDANSKNPSLLDTFFLMCLPELPEELNRPLFVSSSLGMLWIVDFETEGKAFRRAHVIGPAFTESVSISTLESELNQLHFPGKLKQSFLEQVKTLPVISISRFAEYGLMLHYCLTGTYIAAQDIHYAASDRQIPKETMEAQNFKASWAAEQRLMMMVEQGNLDYKNSHNQLVAIRTIGNIGNGSNLRNFKNLCIVSTALVTRAAIRGGLAPEIAYSLSDSYILKIENCLDMGQLYEVNSTMRDDFIRRVHECRKNPNISPQVMQCCYYIQTNLNSKITIRELTSLVGYSENYLSRKFKQEMGVNIVEYINQQKIDYAKRILLSDNTPISDIAETLGFSSQSYFAEQFRRIAGCSPGEYRQRHCTSAADTAK